MEAPSRLWERRGRAAEAARGSVDTRPGGRRPYCRGVTPAAATPGSRSGPSSVGGGRGAGPGPDIDALLTRRLRRGSGTGVLAGRTADLLLDSEVGTWTVRLRNGRVSAVRGRTPRRPDTVVRGDADALAALVSGDEPGSGLFLRHRIAVRGSLALALQLDGLFRRGETDPSAPRAREVHAAGVRTAYLEAGPADAPPVVLVHGLGASNASVLPLLADLSTAHRVLAPDMPGFGASDAPRATYSFGWLAHWLGRFQSATGAEPAVLVGNSLGGRVALEAALRHPATVSALVGLSASPAWRRLRLLAPLARLARPGVPLLRAVPLVPPHALVVELLRYLFSDPERLPRSWFDAGADEVLRTLRSPAHRVAFFASGRQIVAEESRGETGFYARLSDLEPPALFLWGERDRLVPASFARHLVRALPRAQSVVLPDCGHVPQFEHRERTTDLVRTFLARGPDERSEAPPDLGAVLLG